MRWSFPIGTSVFFILIRGAESAHGKTQVELAQMSGRLIHLGISDLNLDFGFKLTVRGLTVLWPWYYFSGQAERARSLHHYGGCAGT